MDYDVPVGLSFAHLKGSIALLNRILEEKRPHEIHYGRVQLHRALDLFQSRVSTQEDFLTRLYERLGHELISNAHTILEIAASRLSRELTVVAKSK